jgi:hypothetical protein
MLKTLITAILLSAMPATGVSAHEIWLERHGDSVRTYVGDATGERDGGDTLVKLVPTSRLFGRDAGKALPIAARPAYLVATVADQDDLRYYNDQVWAPWKTKDGVYEAAAFQARSGRQDVRAVHELELVPVASDSDSFTLMFKGQPLADTAVTLVNPDLWERTAKTDAAGHITVPVGAKGRYILIARHSAPADVEIAGQKVVKLQHVASLSFETD